MSIALLNASTDGDWTADSGRMFQDLAVHGKKDFRFKVTFKVILTLATISILPLIQLKINQNCVENSVTSKSDVPNNRRVKQH